MIIDNTGYKFNSEYYGSNLMELKSKEEPEGVVTLAQAIEIANKQAHNTYTTEKYIVTGTVDDLYNTVYGNMHLLDGKGGDLTIYGLYFGGVKYGDFTGTKPVVGDVITVEGHLGSFNGTPQMKNADFVEFAGQTPEPPVHVHNACPECGKCLDPECPEAKCEGHTPVAEYITIAEAKKAELNAVVTVKGVVSVKTSSHILIQDGKDGIQLYYAKDAAGFADIKVGDEILATGTYTVYNGLHELKSIKELKVLSSGHEVKPIVLTSVAKADIEQYQNMLVSAASLDDSMANAYNNYLDIENKYLLFKEALEYSKMTSKIRKFDNKTLREFEIELEKAENKKSILEGIIEYTDDVNARQNAIDKLGPILEEISKLKVDIKYIESNYKVNISK